MRIKVIAHNQDELNHEIELRIEQEQKPFNSFNPTIKLSKSNTINLSNDELYTLAFNKVKSNVLSKFENDIRGYTEESFNFEGFNLISPKHNSIEIIGLNEITKETNNDLTINYNSIIKDQYGDFFKSGSIELEEEYPNVTLENGLLTIGDFSGQIILKSSYYSLSQELIINMTQTTKIVTDEEKAIDLVKYLMNDSTFLNSVGITVRT